MILSKGYVSQEYPQQVYGMTYSNIKISLLFNFPLSVLCVVFACLAERMRVGNLTLLMDISMKLCIVSCTLDCITTIVVAKLDKLNNYWYLIISCLKLGAFITGLVCVNSFWNLEYGHWIVFVHYTELIVSVLLVCMIVSNIILTNSVTANCKDIIQEFEEQYLTQSQGIVEI
jgi:hypothetical protein